MTGDDRQAGRRLRHNVVTGILGSAWSALASLLVVPVYLRWLGEEAYGLISFFATLQSLLLLLDLGFSTTMNREVARGLAQRDGHHLRSLLRTLEVIYWTMGFLIALALWTLAPLIAREWFKDAALPVPVISRAIALMGAVIAIRWPVGLYLGVVLGAQRAAWANALLAGITTLSTFGAIAVLLLIGPSLQTFFVWQIIVAIINVGVAIALTWFVLADADAGPARLSWALLRPLLGFSGSIAGATLLGAVVLQLDKFLLPRYVPLADVGRYGVIALAARVLLLTVTPIYNAMYPHLTALVAAGREAEGIVLYRWSTRACATAVFAGASYAAIFAPSLLLVWTGDAQLAERLRYVAPLVLFGTALNAMMYFPHALQLAYGEAGVPLVINLGMAAVLVPALMLLLPGGGMLGAAAAWSLANVVNVVLSVYLTHRKAWPDIAVRWLAGDLLLPMVIIVAVFVVGAMLAPGEDHPLLRLTVGLVPFLVSAALVLALSPSLRYQLRAAMRGQTVELKA